MSIKRAYTLYALIGIFAITVMFIQNPIETKEFLLSREMKLACIGLLGLIADYIARHSKNRILAQFGFILMLGAIFLFVWQGFYYITGQTSYFLEKFDIKIDWK